MKELKIRETITVRDAESILMLFRDINIFSVPTLQEEEALAVRMAQGDEDAIREMVNRNMRFVVSVAKQTQGCGLDLGDLISEGTIGLMVAARRFDVTKGFKFCTYAVWWIRQAINKAIGEYGSTIRIPSNQRNQRNKLNNLKNEFFLKNEREPSAEELAELADLGVDKINDTDILPLCTQSLDKPFGDDSENLCLNDVIASEDCADHGPEQESLAIDVQSVLTKLSERERIVLVMSFGIGTNNPQPIEEIADRLGISQERVRQIRIKAINRIRLNKDFLATLKKYAA
mgnify:FL=1